MLSQQPRQGEGLMAFCDEQTIPSADTNTWMCFQQDGWNVSQNQIWPQQGD